MSRKLFGEINLLPWVAVNVEASNGTQEIKVVVDTGFDGELAIPRSLTPLFGTSRNTREADYANGQRGSSMTVKCRVEWINGYQDVIAMYVDGVNALIGMELLEDCLVTLEIEGNGGQITIEAL